MTPPDVNEFFGLSQPSGWEAWQFARPLVTITPEFGSYEVQNRCPPHEFETALKWGPVTYQNKLHKCVGKADYSMFSGEQNHMSCHLVVFEAQQFWDHGASTSNHGQILTYMAIVQASRKARGLSTRGQTDSTMWGALIDGQWFYFFRLNNGGQWSCVAYQVLREY
ncbi:hypothetical protein N7516_007946 [Penicillium verrucosum]|uniref:uncharacterized protein n=1 Tax=Penicillium verrucosum TaxID=60171 RepID=UPI0025450155|nr:uncharacterized protein N7516_007946 [Penicillium verrucosum]KAJ5926173.1 hypothetical protein N7516_007946 [Penicillium verrucosum]